MDDTKAAAKSMGYVETVFGRRLYLPEINSPTARAARAPNAAINAPMQGTAADLIKAGHGGRAKELDAHQPGIKMIMQVHDELVFELPERRGGLAQEPHPAPDGPCWPRWAWGRTGTRRIEPPGGTGTGRTTAQQAKLGGPRLLVWGQIHVSRSETRALIHSGPPGAAW